MPLTNEAQLWNRSSVGLIISTNTSEPPWQNILKRATDLSISNVRRESDGGPDTNFTLLEGVERNAIVQMLKETGGNKLETAKRLGIGRQTLYNKIKAYGIEV